MPAKFAIDVSANVGERLAKEWKQKTLDVVDGYGRPAKQLETEDR